MEKVGRVGHHGRLAALQIGNVMPDDAVLTAELRFQRRSFGGNFGRAILPKMAHPHRVSLKQGLHWPCLGHGNEGDVGRIPPGRLCGTADAL